MIHRFALAFKQLFAPLQGSLCRPRCLLLLFCRDPRLRGDVEYVIVPMSLLSKIELLVGSVLLHT